MPVVLGRRWIVAVLAAVALLGVAGCGGGSSSSGGGSGGGGGQKSTSGGDQAGQGAKLFASNGCSGCHTLKAAGSTGTTGPDLDTHLKADAKRAGKPLKAFVHQSIVDPSAYIAKGYQDGIMPKTFGSSLSAAQVNALVKFVTGG